MPDRPDPSRPPPSGHVDQVDELDLLGWVEGDLPRARQQPVEDLLAREPRLRALLSSMSADRAALRAMPAPAAPADLLSRVEAQLERDLLVGLSGPSTDTLDIPISRVTVKGDGVLARISPALRYASLAASVLIVGALGIVMWPSLTSSRSRQPSGAQPPTLITPGPLAAAPAESSTEASSAPSGVAAGIINNALAKAEPTPSLTDLAIAQADIADALTPADESITPDRALELLREGRLAVRIRTLDRDRTLVRLASIHAEPRSTWSLLDRADETVIAALTPKPIQPQTTLDPSTLASSHDHTDAPRPSITIPPAPPRPHPARSTSPRSTPPLAPSQPSAACSAPAPIRSPSSSHSTRLSPRPMPHPLSPSSGGHARPAAGSRGAPFPLWSIPSPSADPRRNMVRPTRERLTFSSHNSPLRIVQRVDAALISSHTGVAP
jgi:hypothetical protein